MLSFRNIRPSTGELNLVWQEFRTSPQEDHQAIEDLSVKAIDQMLSAEFHEELRIVRRMLTGSKPGLETTSETQSPV